MQPGELAFVMARAGCFVLSSHNEPWGVVVHESALAGLPMILSDAVNAAEQFLIPGYNGLMFATGNLKNLKQCLVEICQMDEKVLVQTGNNSKVLANRNNPELWVANLLAMTSSHRIMNNFKSNV
jgi:glycosyltransferase involved in cell wall biosynthesis